MEQKRTYPELTPLVNSEGQLHMFSAKRFDREATKTDMRTIAKLIDARSLPVANTVLTRPTDIQAVPGILPQHIEDIPMIYAYHGRRENEEAYREAFTEGVSFCTDLLTQKPHLLFTFRGLFQYEQHQRALSDSLPYHAGVHQEGLYGAYPHQEVRVHAWNLREGDIQPEPLQYSAFMWGVSKALDAAADRFQQAVPISNPYLSVIGIDDPRQEPTPEQLAGVQEYLKVAQQVAYVAGLMKASSTGHEGEGVNEAHDVVEMVREKIFRHAQSKRTHFLPARIHPSLHEVWWSEHNPYERYKTWYSDEPGHTPLSMLFPELESGRADAFEQMLREKSPYLRNGDEMKAMGWGDLLNADGEPDLGRFETQIPFWVSGFNARQSELKMMQWEKVRRLFTDYSLLPAKTQEVAGLIFHMTTD